MGKAGSKSKTSLNSNLNSTNDFQLLLKNRFCEIANEKSVIDKSAFFVSSLLFLTEI